MKHSLATIDRLRAAGFAPAADFAGDFRPPSTPLARAGIKSGHHLRGTKGRAGNFALCKGARVEMLGVQ